MMTAVAIGAGTIPQELMDRFRSVPQELKKRPQWVAFDTRKVPKNPMAGSNAKTNDPRTWGSFAQALEMMHARQLPGIGFVFDYRDPYCGIDLDKCRNPETGALDSWAKEIIDRLNSYTEISPSGTGVHILLKAELPKGRRIGQIEAYDKGRYFTVTGQHLDATPTSIEDRQACLAALLEEMEPGRVREGKDGEVESVPFKELIPQSQRRNFLAAIGIALRKWGLEEETIKSGLWPLCQVCCDPKPEPISKREVGRIAKSAVSYPIDWRLVNMKAGPMEARKALMDLGGVAPYTPLVQKIERNTGCGKRAAERAVANGVKWNLIIKPGKEFGYGRPYTVSTDSENARIAEMVEDILDNR